MHVHAMKLENTSFEKIVSGKKTIEIRLCDAKRQIIEKNDRIIMQNRQTGISIEVVVTKLLHAATFKEILEATSPQEHGHANVHDGLKALYQYYTPTQEQQYGVIGIGITPLIPPTV